MGISQAQPAYDGGVASNPVGAELSLLLMARLAEFTVLDLMPDPDSSLHRGGEDAECLDMYQSVLFPVLRLCWLAWVLTMSLEQHRIYSASQGTRRW